MTSLRLRAASALLALTLLVTGCARQTPQQQEDVPTLEQLRERAAAAFDGTASSAQRRTAAENAVRTLLGLLQRPESFQISDDEWTASPRPGLEAMVRHIDLGAGIHLYALALPGRTLVDEIDRVAVQVRSGNSPRAFELSPLPAARLVSAYLHDTPGARRITLALQENERSGYIAHFSGPAAGPFELVTDAFAGMEGTYGPARLTVVDGTLQVALEQGTWSPAFDPKDGSLHLATEIFLKFDGRFSLADESRFDAFALLDIAADPLRRCQREGDCPEAVTARVGTSREQAAEAAWELAKAKLTRQLEAGWSDSLTARLPTGSRMLSDEGRGLSVSLLSIPAPGQYLKGRYFNVVQFRTSGVPATRALPLPGLVESVRGFAHRGMPAMLVVVDDSAGQEDVGTAKRTLYLLRLDAGNDWQFASDWVGYVTRAPYWNIGDVTADEITISWEPALYPLFSVELQDGDEPHVTVCQYPGRCHQLTWVDGRLHSLPLLTHYMGELTRPHGEEDLVWAASQMAEFLALVDPAALTGGRLSQLVDPDGSLGIRVFDVGENTRVITLPTGPGGMGMAVIHAPGQAELVKTYDGVVTRWEGAQIVQAGQEKRLLLLGRSDRAAVLLAYRQQGGRWVPVDALDEAVDRNALLTLRVTHTPGAERPARGVVVQGAFGVSASLTGGGASFCEGGALCMNYRYDGGWVLR
ncbi:hypothetical protein [Symbiobacterium thermophilum]|uniref:Lipoprotein n=1 Tax=Symbiobacterium thermophilum (strain DSM 24528 / JCM 14929 / IAM 14863 / T) TaxID=292459 RepID=Q67JI6_SYMTH|nr:hypothetical protein [Symbiobacterium thermophilum]BAD42164.1 hypothetical protein STH3182 [Symbiobacterium thermophilum IAM 14863]